MSVKAFNASLSLALALSVCLSGCGLGARTAPDDGPATQTKSQSNTRSPREEPSARPSPETPPAQDQTPTVTFDANGGESDTGARDVTYDAEYGELPQPTRLGYDFEGWYTQKEGGEKIGGSTHVAIGKDHTLYAHWRVKPETYLADLTQYEWAGSSGAWSRRTEPGREVLDNHNAIHSYGFVGQEDSVSLLDPNTVTYDIERAYARFTGAWGLQEQSGTTMEGGRALWLEIHGDGRLIYTSPEISSGSAVKPIDIDVSGVQYLKFVLCSNIPPSERIPYWTGYGLFDPILIR